MTILMHTDKYRDVPGATVETLNIKRTSIPFTRSKIRYPEAYGEIIIPRFHPDNTTPFDNPAA